MAIEPKQLIFLALIGVLTGVLFLYRRKIGEWLLGNLQGGDCARRRIRCRPIMGLFCGGRDAGRTAALLLMVAVAAWTQNTSAIPFAWPHPIRFEATNPGWAIVADIKGHMTSDGRTLDVYVESWTISRDQKWDTPEDVTALNVLIERSKEGAGTTVVQHATAHTMHRTVAPGQTIRLDPLTFRVPLSNFQILKGDVVSFLMLVSFAQNGKSTSGAVFARVRVPLPVPQNYLSMRQEFAARPDFNNLRVQAFERGLVEQADAASQQGDIVNSLKILTQLEGAVPISIAAHRRLSVAWEVAGARTDDPGQQEDWKYRGADEKVMAEGLLQSILDSGDGRSRQTAYKVIYIPEEYLVVNRMGLRPIKVVTSRGSQSFDIITAAGPGGEESQVYFDVSSFLKSEDTAASPAAK